MHIRCKFDGGKQIYRSQSGSWQARCAGTGLCFNKGAAWGPHTWKQVLSKLIGRELDIILLITAKTLDKPIQGDYNIFH